MEAIILARCMNKLLSEKWRPINVYYSVTYKQIYYDTQIVFLTLYFV